MEIVTLSKSEPVRLVYKAVEVRLQEEDINDIDAGHVKDTAN